MSAWEPGPAHDTIEATFANGFDMLWRAILCALRGHQYHHGRHVCGVADYRTCWRCEKVWHRDGCAARGCRS